MTVPSHVHDAAALTSLRHIGHKAPNWVPTHDGIDHDVAIVGGGQCGLAIAFALQQAGIGNTILIDANETDLPGIWLTKARMHTLRTVKELAGPELYNPALGFQAWYEARHGQEAYEALVRIPRTDWAEYLLWFRRIVGIEALSATRVERIEPRGRHFRLHLNSNGVGRAITARRVVLATGYPGGGKPAIPDFVASSLPKSHYAHTDEAIDFSRLAGRTVGILGAASAAFDNAATALEAGAATVRLFCRHPDLQRQAAGRSANYVGVSENFYELSDAIRWQMAPIIRGRGIHPTPAVVARAVRFENFRIHLDAEWKDVSLAGDKVRIQLEGRQVEVDHVLLGTGYAIDAGYRPELADFAGQIETWGDRPGLPQIPNASSTGRFPYLGPHYEYREREPGSAPYLANIFVPNFSALVSFARHVGDIPSLKAAIPRLVRGISRSLFIEDTDLHLQRMTSGSSEELPFDAYARAIEQERRYEAAE